MRTMVAALVAVALLAGCTSVTGEAAVMPGNLAYSPPDSFTLMNESETAVSWRSEETGTTLSLLLLPNRQSGASLIENFGQQWSPSNYIGSWFQAGNRSDIARHDIGNRTWLQANVTGRDNLLLVGHLTADDQFLYQFFLVGDRSAVDDLYPTYRATLSDADFGG